MNASADLIQLYFDKGTLVLKNFPKAYESIVPQVQWDSRTHHYRCPAMQYRELVLELRRRQVPYEDHASVFKPQSFRMRETLQLRDYQKAASEAWQFNGSQGIVVLPTGAGKTILAVSLINKVQRPVLVHVPTIDLMHQWHSVLEKFLDVKVGLWGGGYHDTQAITVSTYDSALIHVPHQGNRFGMIIFDECHHLPSDQYQHLVYSSIAPFRLGLTATPERNDGREQLLYELCGDLCYRIHIHELEGLTLSPYDVFTLEVEMTEEEQVQYEEARQCYVNFVRKERINFGQANGWQTFLWKSSRSTQGRQAFKAYRLQKQLSQASSAKEHAVWDLIQKHRGERIIIFTQDNEMAYRLGKKFLLPVLTHHTKLKEREAFLQHFRNGEYSILVTSKVLNEGVDVPEATIAIIVSGSGSIREHVQRLGRILRPQPGKKAILYEIISKGTGEYFINKRRKQHDAYQRPAKV